jgi:hypothetical protein
MGRAPRFPTADELGPFSVGPASRFLDRHELEAFSLGLWSGAEIAHIAFHDVVRGPRIR